MVAVTVLAMSSMGFVAVTISTHRLERENESFANAVELSREVMEQMQAVTFSEVLARFNDDKTDDPEGNGTSVGSTWTRVDGTRGNVEGRIADSDSTAVTCTVSFPLLAKKLREDLDLPEYGLPMDLNGDGEIDSADHSGDYVLLPISLNLQYSGATGTRTLNLTTVLRDG